MRLKKIDAMHSFYGRDPQGRKCFDCQHLIYGKYHDRNYYKCTVYGVSHSEATDWRKSYGACRLIDKEFPECDKRIFEILKHEHTEKNEQLPGQVEMLLDQEEV